MGFLMAKTDSKVGHLNCIFASWDRNFSNYKFKMSRICIAGGLPRSKLKF